jgi:Flp pilus assembly protein TadG
MSGLIKRITKVWRQEDGVASIEFVFALPILMAIFMASFESGLMMTRSILLEQSLDMVMRELRLGHYVNPDAALLKTEICKRTIVFNDCNNALMIDLQKISTTTWAMPTTPTTCVNRNATVQPATTLNLGQQNDLMLVRACIVVDALFPTTGLGLDLTRTTNGGGYEIVAVSAFSNEPS